MRINLISGLVKPVSEFHEFEPRLKSAKNRFQLITGLNLEKLNTILSGTNHIWPRLKSIYKFGLSVWVTVFFFI